MRKGYFISMIFVCQAISVQGQKDTIASRIVLIGDAGQLTNGKQLVVDGIKKLVPMDERTTVIYLGDNLYRTGLPLDQSSGYAAARAVLDYQLSVAEGTKAKVYMIPGNHDWHSGGRDGWESIRREQQYVAQLGKPNVKFLPEDGCPGPEDVKLPGDVAVIFFDSQWWIHPYDKPGIESDCEYKTTDEIISKFDDLLNDYSDKLVIIAGHHTFKSTGVHGGFYTLKQHIFPFTEMNPKLYIPLPVLGTIYPIQRSIFGSPQDLKHPDYADMIKQIQTVTDKYPNVNLIYAAGHEHSMQLIKDSSRYYVVAGTGVSYNRVSKSRKSHFAIAETGFAVLEVSTNKNVRIRYYTVVGTETKEVYTENLLNFTKVQAAADTSTRTIVNEQSVKFKEFITIEGSEKYGKTNWAKNLMIGTNYRKEWSAPVKMKVFDIHTEKGGLTVKSLGGGKQTRSLTLVDKKGVEWKLRSIDKNPANAIPPEFRNTIAGKVVQDFISASHPYGSLTVPTMSKALDIVEASPELFLVPDDPAFGRYREMFKNQVCMLELKKPSRYGESTKSSYKIFNELIEKHDHRVNQPEVLKVRLLDMLIGDFDRHMDQWSWGTMDTGKGKLYYPIPKDRDQAYFRSNGLIISFAATRQLPMLKGFQKNILRINWFNWAARDFDRLFMTDLDAVEWKKVIDDFKNRLPDSVFVTAVNKLPPEILKLDSLSIVSKLISRRNILEKRAMQYYRFLSRRVNVIGSNEKEFFKVIDHPDGLEVKVYAREANNDTSFVMYNRVFDSRVTKEIRLYGLGNDDKFDVDPSVHSKIKLRIIGGKGNDTFDVKGSVRNFLYDLTPDVERNYVIHQRRSRNLFSSEPPVNYYSILGFNYPINRFPRINIGYNIEDGLFIGPGFFRRTFGFRNRPYATEQRLSTLYALGKGAYQIKYSAEVNHFYRNFDLLVNWAYVNPTLNNFFGMGNTTKIDPSRDLIFYRTRYNYMDAELLFRKRYFERLHIMLGPTAFVYWNKQKDNTGKILENPSLYGLDSLSVYARQVYAGAKLALYFNNLNNELFPTRGVKWNNEFEMQGGVSKKTNSLTRLTSDMNIYASLADAANFIAVVRIGGGHIFSKNFQYFQALNLGANNFLRGFRKTRFYGNSLLYNSLELRVKIADVKSALFPGTLGIVAFNDVGRVWLKGESSRKWHDAYGGGLYFIPFKLVIISVTMAFSEEERLLNFSVGTKLNLTF
jgi:hypothetical protein